MGSLRVRATLEVVSKPTCLSDRGENGKASAFLPIPASTDVRPRIECPEGAETTVQELSRDARVEAPGAPGTESPETSFAPAFLRAGSSVTQRAGRIVALLQEVRT